MQPSWTASNHKDAGAETRAGTGRWTVSCDRLVRQREDGQLTTEVGVLRQGRVAADGAETGVRIGEAGREADAGPAADAREDADVLLALVL